MWTYGRRCHGRIGRVTVDALEVARSLISPPRASLPWADQSVQSTVGVSSPVDLCLLALPLITDPQRLGRPSPLSTHGAGMCLWPILVVSMRRVTQGLFA